MKQAAELPTVRCSSPKLGEGEDALPQKILRFSGDPCVGLEGRGGWGFVGVRLTVSWF